MNRIDMMRKISPLDEDTTEDLIYFLDANGFFQCPASVRHHGNYEGGLFDHSYAMYESLRDMTKGLELDWGREESPFLISFVHDLCKCGLYERHEDGTYGYVEDIGIEGHADRSLILFSKSGILLTAEEIFCIRYHMGAFTDAKEWKYYTNAVHRYRNVLWTHTADMVASHIKNI